MSWQQREYAGVGAAERGYRRGSYYGSGMQTVSVTTLIIIANAAVFFLMATRGRASQVVVELGVMQADAVLHGQIWRLFTATYLHASFQHIFFNMLGLYFFGPALEQVWGRRQYFLVYTVGGVIGNVVLTLAGLVGFINPYVWGVGASGSVLAMLGAAAVLFPNAQVYVYFFFPLRIRTFVLLYAAWFVYNVSRQGANYGGDLCHLGGLAVGVWWAISGGFSLTGRHRTHVDPSSMLGQLLGRFGRRRGPGAWGERMRRQSADDELLDRLLQKVHDMGLPSLTAAEREALAALSQRRREEEDKLRYREKL